MASPGIKISALPPASAANATDQLEINQGGVSKRLTIDQLLDVTGGAYLPLAGGDVTGPVTIAPSTGLDMALNTTQNATGSSGGPTNLNEFLISSDTVAAGANFVNGWTFAHHFGGSATSGGREPLAVYGVLEAPTAAASGNRNYCALTGVMIAVTGDNGTAPAYVGSAGAIFGGGFVGEARNGATNLANVTGAEFNTAMQTGSSAYAKSLAQFCSRSDDIVHGSGVDTMLWFYRQVDGATWTHGLLFDYPGDAAAFPFTSASTVLKTGVGTIGIGVDFSSSTVTTAAFKSPGFSVDGNGVVSVLNGSTVVSQIAPDANGAIVLGPKTGGSGTAFPYLDFHTGSATIDTRVQMVLPTTLRFTVGGVAALDISSAFSVFYTPLFTLASATGGSGLRLPHGAAPSSPVNGDIWTTTTGLFVRINGVTKTVTLT
jgi:hypothetical protein